MNLHDGSVENTPKNGNMNNFDLMTDNDDFDRESSGRISQRDIEQQAINIPMAEHIRSQSEISERLKLLNNHEKIVIDITASLKKHQNDISLER